MKRVSALSVSVCLLFLSTVACADDFILNSSVSGTSFDWREGLNYEGGVAPSAGDFVQIPEGVTAKLSAGDAWWDFVSALGRIRPMTETSVFAVDVRAGITNSLACEITYSAANEEAGKNKGGLVKTGGGGLTLPYVGQYAQFTRIRVNGGVLRIMENADALMPADKSKVYFNTLETGPEGKIDILPSGKTAVCHTFAGSGEITSTTGASLNLFSNAADFEFSGRLTGNLNVLTTSRVMLTGTNSTMTGSLASQDMTGLMEKGGVLGITRFGMAEECGSIGCHPTTWSLRFGDGSSNAGGFLYLGTGEITDKSFGIQTSRTDNPLVFDGGAHGGLVLTNSTIEMVAKAAALNHRILLGGSNETACVFASRLIERPDGNGNHVSYHLLKRGTGTWRLAEVDYGNAQKFSGAITVENGTLQFDSIAPVGTMCALGLATNLYACYTGAPDESRRVDWTMALGTDETVGTIEYTGGEGVTETSRRIAIAGKGRILANGENRFRIGDVKSIAAAGANATLALDGSSVADNDILGITDANAGKLGLVKAGSGNWSVSNVKSVRGPVVVRDGTLTVRGGHYTWYRWTIKDLYEIEGQTSTDIKIQEFALFDEDGIRQNIGTSDAEDFRDLKPGEVAVGKDAHYKVVVGHEMSMMFNDTQMSGSGMDLTICTDSALKTGIRPEPGSPETWVPIVMRLPESAKPIHSYDVVYATSMTGKGCHSQPKWFTLEGSVDGVNWDPLSDTNGFVWGSSNYWIMNNRPFAGNEASSSHVGGLAVPPAPADATDPLSSAEYVQVAAGATLRVTGEATIASLRIDATGAGTIVGAAFAEEGTLDVVNLPPDGLVELPGTYEGVSGLSNISNWSVKKDGRPSGNLTVEVGLDGKIRIRRSGLILLFR